MALPRLDPVLEDIYSIACLHGHGDKWQNHAPIPPAFLVPINHFYMVLTETITIH